MDVRARIRSCGDGLARVLIGKTIPAGSSVGQSFEGRQCQIRAALDGIFGGLGWEVE